MRYPHARLLMMARAPVAGEAKTRLIPRLGAEGAAALHAYLVERQLSSAVASKLAPLQLWAAGSYHHPLFIQLQQRYPFELHCQHGYDLGDRMAWALRDALTSVPYVILFGSDIPELGEKVLRQACEAMESGADAVVVPAEDGGYTLIGLRQVPSSLFEGIDWGEDSVMAQTRERMRQLGWVWVELAPLWDVDEPQDLERLSRLQDLPPTMKQLLDSLSGKSDDRRGIDDK